MRKYLSRSALAAALLAPMSAFAVTDYSTLTVDFTGVDAAAVGIGAAILGVLSVFWTVRRVLGLVG